MYKKSRCAIACRLFCCIGKFAKPCVGSFAAAASEKKTGSDRAKIVAIVRLSEYKGTLLKLATITDL